MTTPTRADITAAEARLAASRVRTLESVAVLRQSVRDQIQSLRDKFARPSTVVLAAGVGILVGKFLLRRRRPRTANPRNQLAAGGIVAGVLSRIGWKFAARRLLRWWSSRRPSKPVPPPALPAWPYAASSPASRASARNVGNTLH
jgi:hypothetical protein